MEIDPRVYLAPEVEQPVLPTAAPVVENPAASGQVPQGAVLAGSPELANARAVHEANQTPDTSIGGAFVAGLKSTWTAGAISTLDDELFGPTYEPVPGYNPAQGFKGVQFSLTEEEQALLMKAQSPEESAHKLEYIQKGRDNAAQMEGHGVAAFLGTVLDPAMIGIDILGGWAAHGASALRAGVGVQRTVAAGTSIGGNAALGMVAAESQPLSASEIVTGSLLNGAAAGMVYSKVSKQLEYVDPNFPAKELQDVAQRVDSSPATFGGNPDRGLNPAHGFEADDPKKLRWGSELVKHIGAFFKGTEYEVLYNAIARSDEIKGIKVTTSQEGQAFGPNALGLMERAPTQHAYVRRLTGDSTTTGRMLFLRKEAGADTALHELSHGVIQTRLEMPKYAPQRAAMERIHQNVLAAFKAEGMHNLPHGGGVFLGKELEKFNEFIALSTTSPTFRKWAKEQRIGADGKVMSKAKALLPVPAAPRELTLWDTILDLLSNILGGGKPRAGERAALDKLISQVNAVNLSRTASQTALATKLDEIIDQLVPGAEKGTFTGDLRHFDKSSTAAEIVPALIKDADKQYSRGHKLTWSLYRSLAGFSEEATRVARLLVDDPVNMTGDSVVSQTRAIRADLAQHQYAYQDLLLRDLAAHGAGTLKRIFSPAKSLKIQQNIEKELQIELLKRDRARHTGRVYKSTARPAIQQMADRFGDATKASLGELKASGVKGADALTENAGYFSRKWDSAKLDDVYRRMEDAGVEPKAARRIVRDALKVGMQKANGWDDELAGDIAGAILDRTHRKGYFEDVAFRSHAGNEAAAEVRDILTSAGLTSDRLQRAMDVITGVIDEAGKAPVLKHRVDVDMFHKVSLPDGSELVLHDLIDSNMARSLDQYLDTVAGRSALARKGLGETSDVGKLRTSLLESIPTEHERKRAANLFDQTINSIMGRPVGDDMPDMMRMVAAGTRMVGLASSGLWQVTEYASAMGRYGALNTFKHVLKEMPGASDLFRAVRKDKGMSRDLKDILARNSSADIRIQPYVQRFEDNFEIKPGDSVQLGMLQAQQLVPYINAQKWIQQHQARVVSNLIVDTIHKAARGDVRALHVLEQYGLEGGIMRDLADDIKRGGTDTTKWSDGTWAKVRGPLMKAMDDAVLRNRTGEIPAFAQFSQLGKFIFTFRSFVLGAHNKVMAGTLGRDGFHGLSLLMLYQFPLSMLATAANSTIQGKPVKDETELVKKALGQMSSIGLFSELYGVASGNKQQFGAPGLILVDRLYKVGGALGQNAQQALTGEDVTAGATAAAVSNALPLFSILPGAKALGETFKSQE